MKSNKYQKELSLISKRIKELRLSAGYTSYETFSIEKGIPPRQYWRMESSKSHDFRMSSLLQILEFHNLTLKEFFDGMDE
ncbi:MAG: helix-turn-helix transcriptional regulator [Balneola sp.]